MTAAAQQPRRADSALVIVHGKVRDAAKHEPIGGAAVSTTDGRSISTNELGEFRLLARAGRATVLVRLIGYDSASAEVEAPSPSDTRYVFDMHRAAQSLDTVEVAGSRGRQHGSEAVRLGARE